jgi:hypothetical protein
MNIRGRVLAVVVRRCLEGRKEGIKLYPNQPNDGRATTTTTTSTRDIDGTGKDRIES